MNLEDAFLNCLIMYKVYAEIGGKHYKCFRGCKEYLSYKDFYSWDCDLEIFEYISKRVERRLEFKICEYMCKNNMTRRYWKEVSIKSLLNGR